MHERLLEHRERLLEIFKNERQAAYEYYMSLDRHDMTNVLYNYETSKCLCSIVLFLKPLKKLNLQSMGDS